MKTNLEFDLEDPVLLLLLLHFYMMYLFLIVTFPSIVNTMPRLLLPGSCS